MKKAIQEMVAVKATNSNGKSPSANGEYVPITREGVGEIATRGSERMPGVILTVQSGLFEDGQKFALSSRTTIASEEDLKVLREHADAVAGDAARPVYNPEELAHDEVLEREHQKDLRDRDEEELALQHGYATLAQRKDEAARTRSKVPPAPALASLFLKIAATTTLMFTIAASAHDFIWVMDDQVVSWFLSIVTGLVFGVLITLLILADDHHSERRTLTNWMGLGAGLGIGVAFFLLRITGAEDLRQGVFGLAMSVAEIAIVLFLESVAMSRRAALRHRFPLETAAKEAEGLVVVAEEEVNRRRSKINGVNDRIQAHSRYLEERHVRATYVDQIREAARKAVENGYMKGIAENRGFTRNPLQ